MCIYAQWSSVRQISYSTQKWQLHGHFSNDVCRQTDHRVSASEQDWSDENTEDAHTNMPYPFLQFSLRVNSSHRITWTRASAAVAIETRNRLRLTFCCRLMRPDWRVYRTWPPFDKLCVALFLGCFTHIGYMIINVLILIINVLIQHA